MIKKVFTLGVELVMTGLNCAKKETATALSQQTIKSVPEAMCPRTVTRS